MKKICIVAIIMGSLFFAGACTGNSANSSDKGTDSTVDSNKVKNMENDSAGSKMADRTDTLKASPVDTAAASFAVTAALGGMMEVELGKLAQEKAMNPRVKSFGQMMVDDHTAANNKLKDLAVARHITLPMDMGKDMQDKVNQLKMKTGKIFDKDYMDMMLDDHKKVIKSFEKAGKELNDTEIKGFIVNTIPALQKHLDSARAITGKR
jgi:putative membrane protein